jgi:hypothetical protein
MAVAFVQALGSLDVPGAASAAFTVPAGGVAQGDTIVTCAAGSGTRVLTGVIDSKGNTHTLVPVSVLDGAAAVAGSAAVGYAATALVAGDTITPTFNGTTSGGRVCTFSEFSGVASSSPVDATGTNPQTAATNLTVSASGATTQADEVIIALFALGATNTTMTKDAAYTALADANSSGTLRRAYSEYQIVAATSTPTATATTTGTITSAAMLFTLKGAAAGPSDASGPGSLGQFSVQLRQEGWF